MRELRSDFGKWAQEEYGHYGDTLDEVMDRAVHFSSVGLFSEYETYIKSHHNNAFSDFSDAESEVMAINIAGKLTSSAVEVLYQIVESPRFDGDVVSKNGKSELFRHKLILRIAKNNEFGDNEANELGFLVWQRLEKEKQRGKSILA